MDLLVPCDGECRVETNMDNITFHSIVVSRGFKRLSFTHPLNLVELTVGNSTEAVPRVLDSNMTVSGQVVVVVNDRVYHDSLLVSVKDGATLTLLDGNGGDASWLNQPLVFFRETTEGNHALLTTMDCSDGVSFVVSTQHPPRSCPCWVAASSLSPDFPAGSCPQSFLLGATTATFDVSGLNSLQTDGIVFGRTNVTLTSSSSGQAALSFSVLDAADALVIKEGVIVSAETIYAGRVLEMSQLKASVAFPTPSILQRAQTLELTIGELDANVTLKGTSVSATINHCSQTSTINADGHVSLSVACDTSLHLTQGSVVSLTNAASRVNVSSGPNATFPPTVILHSRGVNLHLFNGIVYSAIADNVVTYSQHADNTTLVVGNPCTVDEPTTTTTTHSVSFSTSNACQGCYRPSSLTHSNAAERVVGPVSCLQWHA